MARCPRCGGPDGVRLLTSIAMCNLCVVIERTNKAPPGLTMEELGVTPTRAVRFANGERLSIGEIARAVNYGLGFSDVDEIVALLNLGRRPSNFEAAPGWLQGRTRSDRSGRVHGPWEPGCWHWMEKPPLGEDVRYGVIIDFGEDRENWTVPPDGQTWTWSENI